MITSSREIETRRSRPYAAWSRHRYTVIRTDKPGPNR